jgi:hypothetical protein
LAHEDGSHGDDEGDAPDRTLNQPDDQVDGEGNHDYLDEIEVASHLGHLVGGEPEEITSSQRGPEGAGQAASHQIGAPSSQGGSGQHQEVQRGGRPQREGQGRSEQAGTRNAGDPTERDSVRSPDQVSDQGVHPIPDGVRPPPQGPDEELLIGLAGADVRRREPRQDRQGEEQQRDQAVREEGESSLACASRGPEHLDQAAPGPLPERQGA